MPGYYPVMLDIRGRPVTVIGGDRVAAQKAAALAGSGACVRVLCAEAGAQMQELAARGRVALRQKAYEPGDLAGAFLVVAATTDRAQIEAIWRETQERGQPVNIVDVPRYCSFILPSILRRGRLTVAVSTEGASPALAAGVRQHLEEYFSAAYETYIELAALARGHLRRQGVGYEARAAFFRRFQNSPLLALLEAGEQAQAGSVVVELLRACGVEVSEVEEHSYGATR